MNVPVIWIGKDRQHWAFLQGGRTGQFYPSLRNVRYHASLGQSLNHLLEARLGVRLFNWATRSVRLTSDGELWYTQCLQALDQIAEAERIITGQYNQPKWLLRVSVGTVYGNYRLAPLLPAFMSDFLNMVTIDLTFPKVPLCYRAGCTNRKHCVLTCVLTCIL